MAERHVSTPERALRGLIAWGAAMRRGRSLSVKPSEGRVDLRTAAERLVALGPDAENAKRLDESADLNAKKIVSLSQLTAGMAIDYIDRLARPIPSSMSAVKGAFSDPWTTAKPGRSSRTWRTTAPSRTAASCPTRT